jgi:methionine synthase I (cobalamin-dependent)
MGHSAEYQTELYIQQLEQMAQTLCDQGEKFREGGLEALTVSTFEQAEQLRRAIAHLRKVLEK